MSRKEASLPTCAGWKRNSDSDCWDENAFKFHVVASMGCRRSKERATSSCARRYRRTTIDKSHREKHVTCPARNTLPKARLRERHRVSRFLSMNTMATVGWVSRTTNVVSLQAGSCTAVSACTPLLMQIPRPERQKYVNVFRMVDCGMCLRDEGISR